MKLFIIILLFAQSAASQWDNPVSFLLRRVKPQFATVLNGTSQYWTKSSPSNLDLNGSEVVTNGTFDANVTGWAGVDATLAYETSIKRTGAGSCKVTATGVVGAYLASNNVSNTTNGKFTFECWVYAPSATVNKTVRLQVRNQVLGTIFQSGNTTLTADTWTKLVVNGSADGTQTGLRAVVQWVGTPTTGDIFYADDASLTQAYDAMIVALVKSTTSATSRIAHCRGAGSTGYALNTVVGGGINSDINDGTTTSGSTTSNTFLNGSLYIVATTIDRSGNIVSYLDGVASGATSVTGKGVVRAQSIGIGALTGGTEFYTGSIIFVQFVRFVALPSDIAQTIAQISAQKKPMSAYSGGQIVAWYDWQSGGYDKSGSGNHLTNVGGAPIIYYKP